KHAKSLLRSPSKPCFIFSFFLSSYPAHLDLHSFPTRRSSDLKGQIGEVNIDLEIVDVVPGDAVRVRVVRGPVDLEPFPEGRPLVDRKSTRLNSSHVAISYAVFCLKKKKLSSTYPRRLSTLPIS